MTRLKPHEFPKTHQILLREQICCASSNQVAMLLGTDITRKLSDIVAETETTILSDEPSQQFSI